MGLQNEAYRKYDFYYSSGTGIGRGLAEALHKLGNKVIISGQRKDRLEQTIEANPGMSGVELNVQDPDSIKAVARRTDHGAASNVCILNRTGCGSID